MKKITKNNFEKCLQEATAALLEMARDLCWNKISENTSYIISEIKNDFTSFKVQRIESSKVNAKKQPVTLEKAAAELLLMYEDLYDINLEIYKCGKKETIIDIRYFPKSELTFEYYKTVKANDPMLHCKVEIPPYRKNASKRFDINWKRQGIRHKWNLFWFQNLS